DLAGDERLEHRAPDLARLLEIELVPDAGVDVTDRGAAAAEVVAALAPDDVELQRAALPLGLPPLPLRPAVDVGLEGAAEPAVAGDHQEQRVLLRAAREQRLLELAAAERLRTTLRRLRDLREHLAGLHGVRPQRRDALLGAVQARTGHHLHRTRDLLRGLDGADALADLFEVGHRALTPCWRRIPR